MLLLLRSLDIDTDHEKRWLRRCISVVRAPVTME